MFSKTLKKLSVKIKIERNWFILCMGDKMSREKRGVLEQKPSFIRSL